MDKVDRQMLRTVIRNPRITFRELADQLHLSIPAIQHRYARLEETKQITGFHALVNLDLFGGVRMMVYGQMQGKMGHELLNEIAAQGSIPYMWCGGMNNLYLAAVLQDISHMDQVVNFAQERCHISNPEVMIVGSGSVIANCPPTTGSPRTSDISCLSELDYRIIQAMHYDARRSVADIAKAVGVTTKTIGKHLDRMLELHLIDLVTRGRCWGMEVINFALIVKLASVSSRDPVLKKMREDPDFHLLNSWVISNKPNMLYFEVQTGTVGEMDGIVHSLRALEDVESVQADISLEEHIFETWRDRSLEAMTFRKK
ncbi:MAG: HTH-type transcriptional regulator Ptr1 [Methanomassiliicoccales archaeon PtaU1.Bin124]|nr:MAG: HTH-type transcriptional regulator Ptr1 [Methanomassiliicoccales archaeon PtaU1.Bin124]